METSELASAGVPKIFNPWNPKNKLIPDAEIRSICKRYGVQQNLPHPEYFRKACIHKSYVDRREEWEEQATEGEAMVMAERPANCLPLQDADNEESEFAGDSILGCIVAIYLKKRYSGHGEGFLTRLRTRIVNNKQLGYIAKKMGLTPWIIVSRHVEEVCAGGRENLRLLGSLFEAWMYALYENFETETNPGLAFSICYTFLTTILEEHVNFADLITDDTNFKDQLLRWFQAKYHEPPRYKEVEVVGPPHDRIFTMGVLDPKDKVIAKSTARNKKVAEQEASRIALVSLGVISASANEPSN